MTASTDPITRQIYIDWEFQRSWPRRKLEFRYTDDPEVISIYEKISRERLFERDPNVHDISSFVSLVQTVGKAGEAIDQGGMASASKHLPQLFAPMGATMKGYVERVLAERVWFILVNVSWNDHEESFIYPANLESSVRAVAAKTPVAEASPTESVKTQMKDIMDSMKNVKDALGELTLLDDEIDHYPKLSDSDKKLMKKQIQANREELIRQLRR